MTVRRDEAQARGVNSATHFIRRIGRRRQASFLKRVIPHRHPSQLVHLGVTWHLADGQLARVTPDIDRISLQGDGEQWHGDLAVDDQPWEERRQTRERTQEGRHALRYLSAADACGGEDVTQNGKFGGEVEVREAAAVFHVVVVDELWQVFAGVVPLGLCSAASELPGEQLAPDDTGGFVSDERGVKDELHVPIDRKPKPKDSCRARPRDAGVRAVDSSERLFRQRHARQIHPVPPNQTKRARPTRRVAIEQ